MLHKLIHFLLWLNGLSVAAYLIFFLGIMYLDVAVFPQWEVLSQPPEVVLNVIQSSSDQSGLKDMAILLHEHLADQTTVLNEMIDSVVFWVRLHFLLSLCLFIANLLLISRLRKSNR
ncbi:hypothetical protein N8Z26_04950 [Burkholderiales bacterium]|nr:hypothetical protein [Burkholderiales bacterium]